MITPTSLVIAALVLFLVGTARLAMGPTDRSTNRPLLLWLGLVVVGAAIWMLTTYGR